MICVSFFVSLRATGEGRMWVLCVWEKNDLKPKKKKREKKKERRGEKNKGTREFFSMQCHC